MRGLHTFIGGALLMLAASGGFSAAWAQESGLEALPNLLQNPSVENGDAKGPTGWKGSSPRCVWDDQVSHSGKHSLRAGPVGANEKAEYAGWLSDKIPLKPGCLTWYSAWTKSKGNGRWGTLIKLDVFDKDGKWLCKFDPYIRDEHDWTELSAAGATPPGTAYGIMNCYLYFDLSVTVWFDDMAVRQAEEGVHLHPAEGETVLEPTPILAWPMTPGKTVRLWQEAEGGKSVTYELDPNYPLSLHVPKPLDPGEWSWRVTHEEKVKDQTVTRQGETHHFIVKPCPYARYAFNFAGEGTPAEPNFTAVTPATAYSDATGYGWVNPQGFAAQSQPDKEYRIPDQGYAGGYAGGNRTRTLLTPLLRSLVQGAGEGVFKAKLPNGVYDIHLVCGHSFTTHAPAYADFDVWIQGKKAANVPIYCPRVFFDYRRCTATVENGELEIAFRSDKLDRAWFVNGLLIFPRSARRQAQWEVDRLWRSFAYIPDDLMWTYMPYPVLGLLKEPKAAPEPTGAEQADGLVLFARPTYDNVYPEAIPRSEERVEKLASFATPGEVADLTFCAYALRDLDDVTVSAGPLQGAPGDAAPAEVQVRKVTINAFHYSPRAKGDYYSLEPDRIETFDSVDLNRGRTQQFWLTISVPADAKAGKRSGAIRLAKDGKTLREIPLEIEVLPFGLSPHHDALDVCFGGAAAQVPGNATAAVKAEAAKVRTMYLQDMNAHLQGANLALEGVGLRRDKDGTIHVDAAGARQGLQEYREAGVRVTCARVNLQGTLGQLAHLLAPEEGKKFDKHITAELHLPDSYYDELAKVVAEIDKVAREGGAERVIYMIWDECGGYDLPLVIGAAKAIRKAVKDPLVYCNVPKSVYYGFGDTKPEMALAPWCNVWWVYGTLNDEEQAREAKRGTLLLGGFSYGPPANARASSGFFMWRRNQAGGVMWAYDGWYASASSQLDGPYWGDACHVYPTMPITPRLNWEATRQGVYDLRYLLTLEEMIARARKAGKARAADAAQQWRDSLWKSLDPMKDYPWTDSTEYQKHRRLIADQILSLIQAGVSPATLRTE